MKARNQHQAVTEKAPAGAFGSLPPPILTGGESGNEPIAGGNQLGTERYRVNLSLPSGVHAALASSAEVLGMSVSQVAMSLILESMPYLAQKVQALIEMKGGDSVGKK